MADPRFYRNVGPFRLCEIAHAIGANLRSKEEGERVIADVAPLETATSADLSFFINPKYRDDFFQSRAGACLLDLDKAPQILKSKNVPPEMTLLPSKESYRSFGEAVALFYPDASRCGIGYAGADKLKRVPSGAYVATNAILEDDVVLEAGATIGANSRIGCGSFIGAHSVIGMGVTIGRGSFLAPHVSVSHSLLGDRVVLHNGARIGQDGFGFAMSPKGHSKIPQIGRVIIQDDVEIGANTTIDRGFLGDTVIGADSKIDNLVQIAHNVVLGRGCLIAGQAGISGSTKLGEFVAVGGQAGIAGHIEIGTGTQIAAASGVVRSIGPGEAYGGCPARPIRQWRREAAVIAKLALKERASKT